MSSFLRVLLLVPLSVLAAPQDAADNRIHFDAPVTVTEAANVAVRGGKITPVGPLREQQQDFLCVEAEEFSDVYWQEVDQNHTSSEQIIDEIEGRSMQGAVKAEGASGGGALERFSEARWIARITRPGDYTVWHRVWVPAKAQWNYRMIAARIPGGDLPVSIKSDSSDGWFWVKAGTIHIPSAGAVRFIIRDFINGIRFDKFVLHRDSSWTPTDEGPPASAPGVAPMTGRLMFHPARPGAPVTWKEVVVPGLPSGAKLEVRPQPAAPWTPVPADGSLASLPGDASPEFRLVIPTSKGFACELPTVRYEASIADFPTLSTSLASYLFDRATGALVGARLNNGVTLVPFGAGSPPFRVFLKPDNNSAEGGTWLDATDFKLINTRNDEGHFHFEFQASNHPLKVSLDYKANPLGYLDAVIGVENNTDTDLLEVEFPRVPNVRVGDSSSNDMLIWPDGTGKKYPEPSALSGLTTEYPRATMPWCAVYDGTAGFYFGAHDPDLVSMEMRIDPDESRTWLNLVMTKRDQIKASGGKAVYPFAMGAFPGSWHTAAPWYRKWFETRFPRATWPEWIEESDGWLMGNIKGYSRYALIKEIEMSRAIVHGLRHVQLWATDTFNSCPVYYLPAPLAGGPDEFASTNKWWRDQGGHIGYYVLPQGPSTFCFHDMSKDYLGSPWTKIPDWGRPPGKLEGTSWAWLARHARYERPDRRPPEPEMNAWKRDLAQFSEAGSVNFPWQYTAMSMYSSDWCDWFTQWVLRYITDFHSSTVYLDTFHTQAQIPDYNPFFGLHGAGKGGLLRSNLARRISEEGRKLDPAWLPIMEMQCDAYNPWMASQAGSSSLDSEFTRFTHPDFLFFEGQTGRGWGLKRFKRFNSCWMYGNRLDHREYEGWATEIIHMRGWITRWINAARFMDDLGLEIKNPELRGKLHRVNEPDGSRGFLAMFWNTARRERFPGNATLAGRDWKDDTISIDLAPMAAVDNTGTLPDDWIPNRAILIDMGEAPREIPFEVTRPDGKPRITFQLPPRQVNGVLFVREAAGPRSVLVRWDQKDFRQTDVHLINPGTKPATGNATVNSSGVAFTTTSQPYTLAPGERTTLTFPYKDGLPPNRPAVVNLDVAMSGTTRHIFAGAYPFADNRSFEDESGLPTTAEAAFDGNRSLVITKQSRLRMRLEPDTKYKMSIRMRPAQGPAAVNLLIGEEPSKQNRVDGQTLLFTEKARLDAPDWSEISFTFLTPHLYHDGTLTIRTGAGQTVFADHWTLETLPADAAVEHSPDTWVQMDP